MRIFLIGPFRLNADHLRLSAGTSPIPLGPKVVETLLALIELGPGVVTKDALIARIWPEGFIGEPNLSQNIYVLRKVFRDYGLPHAIATQARVGYWLKVDATTAFLTETRSMSPRVIASAMVAATICLLIGIGALFAHQQDRANAASDSQRLYAIGRYYWNLRTQGGVQKSLDYFAQAIDRDPNNARAFAAMADANVTMGDYCFGTHQPSVYFSRAQEYANQAVMLDGKSSEAHASLGFIRLHQNRVDEGIGELRTSIRLNAAYASAREWYGIALLQRGDLSGGRAQLATAARLDPLSTATIAWLGSAAYGERRYHEAILYSNMALELSPARMDSLAIIGQAYAALGNIGAATGAFSRYASISPYYRPQAAAMLALAQARANRLADAKRNYAYARDHANDVDDADLAAAAKALGDFQYAQEIDRSRIAHASWNHVENAHWFALKEDLRENT